MGLKFARALGAEVALFTRSPGKEEEARRLGADQVILSTDPQRMAAVAGRFDLILDTVPHQHDLNPYLATLKRDGTLVLVGLLEPLEPAVHGAQLVMGRRSIAGSAIGGIAETQEMLDFCAAHGIACDIEMIEIQQINQAYERMLASDVKYRFVIDMASCRSPSETGRRRRRAPAALGVDQEGLETHAFRPQPPDARAQRGLARPPGPARRVRSPRVNASRCSSARAGRPRWGAGWRTGSPGSS